MSLPILNDRITHGIPIANILILIWFIKLGCNNSTNKDAGDSTEFLIIDVTGDVTENTSHTQDTGYETTEDRVDIKDANDDIKSTVDIEQDTSPDSDTQAQWQPKPCEPTPEVFRTTAVGEWIVRWSTQTGSVQIIPPHGGKPVWSLKGTCTDHPSPVRVATGVPYAETSFGAFRIFLESGTDPTQTGMQWTGVAGPPRVLTGQSVTIEWTTVGGELVQLQIAPHNRSDLKIWLETSDRQVQGGEISFDCTDGEGFFGLGTQSTGMNLRGHTYPLWTQEQGIGKPEGGGFFPLNNIPEAAYAPMGVWFSSRGATFIVTHDAYSEIDLCANEEGRGALRSAFALPGFVLVSGTTPKERLTRVSDYVGRVSSVAPWVFGPWNDSVGGPTKLWQVAQTLREHDVPSSAIWSEDWIGGEQTSTGYRLSYAWAWDPTTYPDLPKDIEALHAAGFAFLAYFNPFVPKNVPMFLEGEKNGGLIHKADSSIYEFLDPAFRDASMVDLTNPAAQQWLKSYLTIAAQQLNIDGWMADFAEWLQHDAVMYNGDTGWVAHNRYPLQWQQINREVMEEVHHQGGDWTFFVRSGWASIHGGTAGLAPVMWGGDQNTDWKPDDGIPSVTPIATHVGMAGVAIFGSDIAGYTSVINPNTDKELFFRWAAMGAFHPVMRTHHGSDECENWSFDRDPQTLQHYRRFARIHTLLFPLFQQLLVEAQNSGLPMIRHPYLVYPELTFLWSEASGQFFLGDNLLVAPVVTQGASTRWVLFPTSGFWPLFGDTPLDTTAAEVAAPLTEIPVFVRPGTALMLLCSPVDSFYGATNPDVTDLADVAGCVRVGLYPDVAGTTVTTSWSGITINTIGLTSYPDWSQTQIAGKSIPACDTDNVAQTTCFMPDGLNIIVVDKATLDVGSAQIVVTAADVVTVQVYYAGQVFGEDADPTEVGELFPDIPPPCFTEL
ncbi:MAG: hypothetical protein HUU55_18310 [Myxococcales bacterium]|nr:hypothetical protein [Myxococcales bacterium]